MYASDDFSVEIVPIASPNMGFQPLKGVQLRNIRILASHSAGGTVGQSSWQELPLLSQQSLEINVQGVVHNGEANRYLRQAALAGQPLLVQLVWPGIATSQGQFVIANYEENGDADSALSYSVLLRSNAVQQVMVS